MGSVESLASSQAELKECKTHAAALQKKVEELEKDAVDLEKKVQDGNPDRCVAAVAVGCVVLVLYVAYLCREVWETTEANLKKKVQERDTTVADLKKKVQEREADLEKYKTHAAALQTKVEVRDTIVADLKKKVQEREADLEKYKTHAAALQTKVEEREADLEKYKTHAAALQTKVEVRDTTVADLKKKVQEREADLEKYKTHAAALQTKVEEREKHAADLEQIVKVSSLSSVKISSDLEKLRWEAIRVGQHAFWSWDVEKPAEMKATHPKGKGFKSSTFDLAGLGGPWRVCIAPSGGSSSAPMGVQVELWRDGSDNEEAFAALVEARVSIGGASARWSRRHATGTYSGWWTNFPGLTWPQSDEAPLHVEVEVLQTKKWSGN